MVPLVKYDRWTFQHLGVSMNPQSGAGIRSLSKLGMLLFLLFALVAAECEISLSATATPAVTEGTTVFSAINWGDSDDAIDVVFIPDEGYGSMSNVSNRQAFLDDVADMIDTGFWKNNAMFLNLGLFNFWFMTSSGEVLPPTGSSICPSVTWPDLTDAAFAEVKVLLHTNALRDCAFSGGRVTSEPTSYRTVVHETSHAAFGLPDEYCCDGGYSEVQPILYTSSADCNGDPVNAAWRSCSSFTADSGTVWWRSENNTTDIMSSGGSVVLEYGEADWVVVEDVLDSLSSFVNTPSVFAPGAWP